MEGKIPAPEKERHREKEREREKIMTKWPLSDPLFFYFILRACFLFPFFPKNNNFIFFFFSLVLVPCLKVCRFGTTPWSNCTVSSPKLLNTSRGHPYSPELKNKDPDLRKKRSSWQSGRPWASGPPLKCPKVVRNCRKASQDVPSVPHRGSTCCETSPWRRVELVEQHAIETCSTWNLEAFTSWSRHWIPPPMLELPWFTICFK